MKLQCCPYRETCSVTENCKTKYACIVEAHESTRKRVEGTLHKVHEDHIAGNIPEAKAAVEKEWAKLEKIPAWQLTKVRTKKR